MRHKARPNNTVHCFECGRAFNVRAEAFADRCPRCINAERARAEQTSFWDIETTIARDGFVTGSTSDFGGAIQGDHNNGN
jgi:predicted nucleic acid-binding Zn ribbon protein